MDGNWLSQVGQSSPGRGNSMSSVAGAQGGRGEERGDDSGYLAWLKTPRAHKGAPSTDLMEGCVTVDNFLNLSIIMVKWEGYCLPQIGCHM